MDLEQELAECNENVDLLRALNSCDWSKAKQLIEENSEGIQTITPHSKWNVLHFAIFNNAPISILNSLFERDSTLNVNACDSSGYSSVYLAVQKNVSLDTVRLLLEKGGNLNSVSLFGMTPVHACIFHFSSPELLVLLLENGGDPNAIVKPADTKISQLLEQFGKTTISSTYDGANSLVLALIKNSPENILDILLKYGADPSIQDEKGKNSLDYARLFNRPLTIIEKLLIAEDLEELKIRRCSFCSRIGTSPLPRCSACDQVSYCDKNCQAKHWKIHKPDCLKVNVQQI